VLAGSRSESKEIWLYLKLKFADPFIKWVAFDNGVNGEWFAEGINWFFWQLVSNCEAKLQLACEGPRPSGVVENNSIYTKRENNKRIPNPSLMAPAKPIGHGCYQREFDSNS
jgi:hypothetical protein